MIPRAALRAVRFSPPRAVTRHCIPPIASTSQWIRHYANNNRPPQKPDQGTKINNGKSESPVNPKQQPEFDAEATPERNTAPTTEQPPEQPQKPLPDLRQGIPSTFEAEFLRDSANGKAGAKPDDHHNITEDPEREPSPGGAGGREGGELPKSAYETSTDRRRNRLANYGYIGTAVFGIISAVYLGRDWDSEEEEKAHPEAPSGWGVGLMYGRARARLNSQMGYYTEPTFPKLLPDVDPAPPLTLVLSLEDLLVHSEWTAQHGWRTAKRPGVDYFLRYLTQYYELVIFTSVRSMDADPVIRKLDPFGVVQWPLFREATRYEKGEYIKDLSYLNRDLSKTIIIDTDPSHVKLQPDNAIILPKWKGQPGDKGLVALIPFLEYIAMGGVNDVRTAIKSFEGKDIATEFARREAIAREEFNRELAARKSKKGKFNAGGFIMGALGLKGQQGGMTLGDGKSVAEGFDEGKMLSDQFRERGQKAYEEMEKQIRENGETWLKEMADKEKEWQEEQMKNMKTGYFGWLGGAGGSASSGSPGGSEKK